MTRRSPQAVCVLALLIAAIGPGRAVPALYASASDVVLYAADVTTWQGNWARVADASAAGGLRMQSTDLGWSATANALAAPADYFEAAFNAPAGTTYHVWLRLRAGADSKWNDSVWVQFSDATDGGGSPVYQIGTTDALLVNLESCSGCGVSGWGWEDKGYWLAQSALVRFSTSGTHRVRIQTREDGVRVDQIVLSSSTYLNAAPGAGANDGTILPESTSSTVPPPSSTPFSGTPVSIPGTIQAENFDNGGEGVAYHDTTPGNSGGAYRATDVDLEASTEGGYDVGWAAAGEWLNYSVTVASAGAYNIQLRVASQASGGALHVGFNGGSGSWVSASVPATGGWQTWTTVTVPATLSAGAQLMTLSFDTGGFNVNAVTIASAGPPPPPPPPSGPTPFSGTPAAIPGTIQAENFDNGGEGVAYHDTTAGNSGGAYRSTDVDLEGSVEGGYDVGWIAAGEWLNYSVNVAAAGSYVVQLRVASQSAGGALHVNFDGPSAASGSVTVPATGGWQNWATVSLTVTLAAGQQSMRLSFDSSGFNVNSIAITAGTAPPPPPPPPPPPTGTSASVVEWNIQVDDGSAGHARTAVDYVMALSPQPKIIVFEEAHLSQYGTYLSELQALTGQTWSGVFQTHCAPGMLSGVTCYGPQDEGVVLFTSFPIISSEALLLPFSDCWHSARAAVHAQINVNGVIVQAFGAHLQTGSCSDVVVARSNSMNLLKTWASSLPGPYLVAGDFNADPDQIDTYTGMLPTFLEAWQQVSSGPGYTAFVPTPTMHIDYWFGDATGKARPTFAQVVTWTGSFSDHFPVHATFTFTP